MIVEDGVVKSLNVEDAPQPRQVERHHAVQLGLIGPLMARLQGYLGT